MTLIDGTDRTPVRNATIVVRDGRIVAAGAAQSVTIPPGAGRIALDGKTVIPGLINAHGHVTDVRNLHTYAAHGVTTIYSLGDEPAAVFAARDAQANAGLRTARVHVAGAVLAPRTADEARTMVRAEAARRVDVVKIRVDDNLGTTHEDDARGVSRGDRRSAQARTCAWPRTCSISPTRKTLLDAGVDFIAHSVRDADVDAGRSCRAMKASGTCATVPTLMREVIDVCVRVDAGFLYRSVVSRDADTRGWRSLKDPARQKAMRTSATAQRYKVGARGCQPEPQALVRRRRHDRDGHGHRAGRPVSGLLRADGAGAHGEGRIDAAAGAAAATRDAARCMKRRS